MAETRPQGAHPCAGIDLGPFYRVFFEEAAENLASMEQRLLELDLRQVDEETLNAIFRCAHSVKGGAATFGFADVTELTHEMETLLDKLRRHELAPSPAMVDALLAAGDALKAMLARHAGDDATPSDTGELRRTIRALAGGQPQASTRAGSAAVPPPGPAVPHRAGAAPPAARLLDLTVGPLDDPSVADGLIELFREIPDLGTIEPLDGGRAVDGLRRFRVVTTASDGELIDLFGFHVARDQVRLGPADSGRTLPDVTASARADAGVAASSPIAATPVAPPVWHAPRAQAAPAPALAVTPESNTLRVPVEKVDQLINLVGELVITQATLVQGGRHVDSQRHDRFASGLAALERHTRALQDAVMSIRMMPISLVFNRFPRMLRDLAGKLGKQVELVQQGEATELDKGMVEKITDPLTHLVRNSCDHGIEPPAERLAQGKPAHGTITLAASHQGGSIVIEVRDDGRGLNRAQLLAKARERGLDAPDSMSDPEVYALVFAPGFSTAEQVTDVSGRGVGMDVVKRNIHALGGRVEIDSSPGRGMTVRVRLPLTLAIMDGMSVGVGAECYILPLSSVVESFQVRPGLIRTLGGSARVVEVRDEFMPVLDLGTVFDVPRLDPGRAGELIVVVEAEGSRLALRVDDLLGQQQVVVKNLETHYRKVPHVSGATILGDGRVALILDVASLLRCSRH